MNKYYIKSVFVALFLSVSFALFSQGYVSINQTGAASTNPAILDLSDASNLHLGFLMPNVSLASTTDATTIPGPTVGMIVWNTNAALPLGVGYYYWTGTTLTPNNTWLYINNSGGGSGVSGAGTANYVSRWTSTSNLGTGAAQDNGTGVSISSTALTPVNKLDVNGNAAFGTYAGTAAPAGGIIISGQTGFGTSSPNASAALDITSTIGGLLPPRMSAGQMALIGAPAAGLMVFNTTNNCIEYYTGSAWQFVTCQCTSAPTTPGAITGSATPCATSTGNTYSITAIPGALYYTWTVPSGATITAGTGTNSITVTMGTSNGSITVKASNSCGTSTASTLAVTLSPVPATPGIISGNATPCISSGGNVYSIASVPGATTYNWTVPAGAIITGGAGTTSITVTMGTTAGNISVTATNACGTSAASTLAVTLSSTPSAPGAITGTATPCASSTGNVYSIAAVAGATVYNWTVPAGATITLGAGTTSITVTMGTTNGNITVTAGNACGTSAAGPALALTLNNIPATPGAITGLTSYCGLYSTSGHTYSITAVPGATSYTWTVPGSIGASFTGQGTTSINVTLASSYGTGVITVTATDACGTSAASSTATITNNATPPTPATPSGNISPATNTAYTYTIATIANATSYTWSTSNTSLAAVTAGGNSTSATITNTSTGGTYTICVTATNSCGTSGSACLTVTSHGCSMTVSASTTTNETCNHGFTGVVTCTPAAGSTPYTYSWNSNPIQTTQTATALPGGTYIVTVHDNAGCVATASTTVTMPTAVASITTAYGTPNTHKGTFTSSTTGSGTITYAWSPTTNLSSGTVAAPTYTVVAGESRTYTVTITATTGGCAYAYVNVYGGLAGALCCGTQSAGTINAWTVPSGVTTLKLLMTGAQGGPTTAVGGQGAEVVGSFSTIVPGHVINSIAGQQGGDDDGYSGGGGGGSYVWDASSTTLPLAVAGGGGGGQVQFADAGGAGSATTTPTAGVTSAAGGSGGNGGAGGLSAGGCGWLSVGGSGTSCTGGFYPTSTTTPGYGGASTSPYPSAGGFGGGGGDYESDYGNGAGGGGYNGGGGGNGTDAGGGSGGGGGSYISPSATGTALSAGIQQTFGIVIWVW